jgi:hypothetical protein
MWRAALAEFQWAETRAAQGPRSFYAYALARAGNVTRRRHFRTSPGAVQPWRVRHRDLYAGLGDYVRAFAWLEKSIEENTVRPYLMGPMFDHVRRDARFARIRDRLGL